MTRLSQEHEFARLLTLLKDQGPDGLVGAEMASFFYDVAKSNFRRRDRDNVVGVIWLELQLGLGKDPKVAPQSSLTLTWLIDKTHHRLRSEYVGDLHGVPAEEVRDGRWKKTRKAAGLGKNEIMLQRVGALSDWDTLLNDLTGPEQTGRGAFEELHELLQEDGLGLSVPDALEVISQLMNQASQPKFSRKASLKALDFLPVDVRESLVDLAFAVDGYIVPRLLGHSQESAVRSVGFAGYADALLRRKAYFRNESTPCISNLQTRIERSPGHDTPQPNRELRNRLTLAQ